MKTKILWFIGFVVAAAISCWATSSSLILMMPSLFSSNPIVRLIMVWLLVIIIYVLASLAMKWVIDSVNNDGTLEHPKAMLWGGIATLCVSWIIISLPTNAHTFFYKLKIGDVITEDLSTTRTYSQQLADRIVIAPEYSILENDVLKEWELFEKEVKSGITGSGFGKYAASHISKINTKLTSKYFIPTPKNTNKAKDDENTALLNYWKENYLAKRLEEIKSDKYQVDKKLAKEARMNVNNMVAMEDSIHQLIYTNQISEEIAEPLITQADGVLKKSYTDIKKSSKYVKFKGNDESLYTKDNIETKTSRFLNPYAVVWDYFTGKIPFTFTFWLLLSIVIDLAGFFFFFQWQKKEYVF